MYPQRSRIPDRWSDYSNFKGVIKECRILPCKTPLKEELFRTGTSQELLRENQNFTPDDLCEMVQENLQSNVEFVIDFTNTNRYYDSRDFEKRGIKYIKIECVGKQVPSQDVYKMFHMAVDKCLQHATPQGVIAVHCTHGLNRSGFLVCNYLMNKYDYTVEQSVEIFNDARGHDIERTEYIDKLRIDKYPAPINNTFEFEERPIETITTDSIASLVREQHTRFVLTLCLYEYSCVMNKSCPNFKFLLLLSPGSRQRKSYCILGWFCSWRFVPIKQSPD